MIRQPAALLALLLVCSAASAQSVQQSGTVTAGHVPAWVASGVVKDGGPATAGNITELGITKNGGLPFCISTSTGAITGTPYDQMCLSATLNGAARIDVNSYNGAASIPFIIALNGTPVFTSGSTPTQIPVIDRITSGTTATAPATFDVTVVWASAATSAKTTSIAACASALAGFKVTVKDEQANAQTYSITTTPGSGTIDNKAKYIQHTNGQSLSLQCDGVSNWMIN